MDDFCVIEDADPVVSAFVNELEELCGSKALSLDALRNKIAMIPDRQDFITAHDFYSFFHRACENERMTLEMAECILEAFPEAAAIETYYYYDENHDYHMRETTAYPIHLACANERCPDAVIRLLVERNPSALDHLSTIMHGVDCGDRESCCVEGTPLHYYLARKSSNIDIGVVKMMVDACPRALLVADDMTGHYCLHTLVCNPNNGALLDVVKLLIDAQPQTLQLRNGCGEVPLHAVCSNSKADSRLAELLLYSWEASIRQENISGQHPLHALCDNEELDDAARFEVYRLIMGRAPELVRVRDADGFLPLHLAVRCKSLEFCKILIDAYPEAVRAATMDGTLPLHEACINGCLNIVSHLLQLHPESIHVTASDDGYLPLHHAAERQSGEEKAEIMAFLLSKHPASAERTTTDGSLPLHLACGERELDLISIQQMFDIYPQAIFALDRMGKTPVDLAAEQAVRNSCNSPVVSFFDVQLDYHRTARDTTAMTTPDENGWLPLHHALRNNATLGAIKLLVRGNPSALRVVDKKFSLPLHIACEYSTLSVVMYMLDLDGSCLNAKDENGDTAMHYVCRGGNCEVIEHLLERHVSSVSERNNNNQLPVHLLCEAGGDRVADVNCQSPMYVEIIWRLLLAHPETALS